MSRFKILFLAAAISVSQWAGFAAQADAQGPLRNWLRNVFGRGKTAQAYLPNTGTCATNPYGLQPGQCATTYNKTCSKVVVNYVPYTAYRTNWQRVPVTQYKPVTKADPVTGCTVTCMRPCTTYTYQMQRVPYTTYRPVYRTQTYKVPVTTISNDCNTCATGCSTSQTNTGYAPLGNGCSTCSVPGLATGTYAIPSGTISNGATYTPLPAAGTNTNGGPTPADSVPRLQDSPQAQQRVYDQIQGQSSSSVNRLQPMTETWSTSVAVPAEDWTQRAPARIYLDNLSVRNPVQRDFSYSPVRQASYTSIVKEEIEPAIEIRSGRFSSVEAEADSKPKRKTSQMWKSVDW